MRTLCLLLGLMSLSGALFAQTPAPPNAASAETPVQKQQLLWQKLEAEVAETDRSLDGVVGVALTDLTSGQQLLHNADQVFPTASVIKLAVLAELYHQEEQGAAGTAGKARLADLYTVRKEDLVPDSDILGGLTPGVSRLTNRDWQASWPRSATTPPPTSSSSAWAWRTSTRCSIRSA